MEARDMRLQWVIVIVAMCLAALLSSSAIQGQTVEGLPIITVVDLDCGWLRRVNVWGDHLYMSTTSPSERPSGVVIMDVRDPAKPVRVGYIDDHYGRAAAFSGHYIFLARHDPDGFPVRPDPDREADDHALHVVDIADPAHPVLVATNDTVGAPQDIEVYGNYAYVVSSTGYDGKIPQLFVFDITDPTKPIKVASLVVNGDRLALVPPELLGAPKEVERPTSGAPPREGPLLCVCGSGGTWSETHLTAISMADPSEPRIVASSPDRYRTICRVGSVLVMTPLWGEEREGQLVFLDGTKPFTELGCYDPKEAYLYETRPGAGDHHVYYADWEHGDFHVLDISKPHAPVKVARGQTALPGLVSFTPTALHVYMAFSDRQSGAKSLGVMGALKVAEDVKSADMDHPLD